MPHAATEFLTTIQRALGGDVKSDSRVEFTGEGALPSVFAVTDLAAGSIGAAALAVLEYADAGAAMTPACERRSPSRLLLVRLFGRADRLVAAAGLGCDRRRLRLRGRLDKAAHQCGASSRGRARGPRDRRRQGSCTCRREALAGRRTRSGRRRARRMRGDHALPGRLVRAPAGKARRERAVGLAGEDGEVRPMCRCPRSRATARGGARARFDADIGGPDRDAISGRIRC